MFVGWPFTVKHIDLFVKFIALSLYLLILLSFSNQKYLTINEQVNFRLLEHQWATNNVSMSVSRRLGLGHDKRFRQKT